jgi:glutamate/tyrosine decarboxylase-like PLP-dependent enzyme
MGFPADTAMGLLVSGGSMATLTSLAVARQWVAEQDGWDVRADGLQSTDRPRYVFYLSDQAHSSVTKAVELLGFGNSSIRKIPVDGHFRMDAARLAAAVAADRRDGYRPMAVVASAGTTNTGAVDPLDRIADICAEQGMWMHVDGAYGAFGVMHPELAGLYTGLSRANSITLDPHKWLSVPIECGCALVRDRALMRRTFSLIPPYLRTEEGVGVGGPPSYAEYGFQQTRSFRSLKFWMTLQHMGRDGFRAMVIRHIALARLLAGIVEGSPDFELMAPVTLSVVCFRYVPPGGPWQYGYLDQLNRSIEAEVQTDGRVFLTATTLRGRFVLRACVLHYGTTRNDIKAVADVVRQIGLKVHQEAQRA